METSMSFTCFTIIGAQDSLRLLAHVQPVCRSGLYQDFKPQEKNEETAICGLCLYTCPFGKHQCSK